MSYFTSYTQKLEDEKLKNDLKVGNFNKKGSNANVNNKAQPITSGGVTGTISVPADSMNGLFAGLGTNDNTKPGPVVKNNQSANQTLKIDTQSKNRQESWKDKTWGEMTKGEKFQAGAAKTIEILDTIDTLSGGKDTVLSGSGHSKVGYDPYMHIGHTV